MNIKDFITNNINGIVKQDNNKEKYKLPESVKEEEIELLLSNCFEVNLPDGSTIYNHDNIEHKQFGGNQGALYEDLESFLEDPNIIEICNKYFDTQISSADLELLFYRMNSVGCGYVAAINVLMEQYLMYYDENDFYNTFGFYPYTLKRDPTTLKVYKDFNYEYLFLDFFLYYAKNEKGFSSIEEILGNTEEEKKWRNNHSGDAALDEEDFERTGMIGTQLDIVGQVMQRYLNEKGISISSTNRIEAKPGTLARIKVEEKLSEMGMSIPSEETKLYIDIENIDSEIIQEIINSGQEIIISMKDFTLYYSYDLDGNGVLDDIYRSDVGPHGMSVVGTTDDGKLIVSSWGQCYLVDLEKDNLSNIEIYEF